MLFLTVCAIISVVVPAWAQTRNGVVFQVGPTINSGGASSEVLYFSHWSDQWSWEVGMGHRLWFLPEHLSGHITGMARIRYVLDIFRLLPSLYAGLGGGWMPDESVSVMELQYGIAADYLLSRRWLIGFDASGVNAIFSAKIPDAHNTPVSSAFRFQVLFRLQWVWGETW